MARLAHGSVALAALLATAGCVMTPPEKAMVARQPSTAPARTVSSFSEALRCMDTLLWTHGKSDIYITSNGIPDATGRLLGGTKEMVITSVSRMSDQSKAFSFVDFEPNLDSVNALYWMVGVQPEFRAPSYYIRGAVTQLDENVLADAASAGISLPDLDLGVSQDQIVSVVSVDLSVGELVTRRILPGVTASNSIAVVQSGVGGDAAGIINKTGLSFNIALNRSEGLHQALRTLIELSTIEVLGKLTRVPYWQCLGIEQTNPAFMSQAQGWFDDMGESERLTYAQRVLQADGYYQGAIDGKDSEQLRAAIGRWQTDHDLIATGRVDFDLYQRMLGSPKGKAIPASTAGRTTAPPAPLPKPSGPGATPDLVLSSDRGPRPSYRAGETMVITAQPTADGFLYCYYADAKGQVSRIFPNRFQPNALVEANRQVEIPPGPQRPFNIRVEQPGATETIACAVSAQEVGLALPERFKAQDLQPISGAGLPQVMAAFTGLPKTTVTTKQMAVQVLPSAQ